MWALFFKHGTKQKQIHILWFKSNFNTDADVTACVELLETVLKTYYSSNFNSKVILMLMCAQLLTHALNFPHVKRLVYSTCATSRMENEDVIQEVQWIGARHTFVITKEYYTKLTGNTYEYT